MNDTVTNALVILILLGGLIVSGCSPSTEQTPTAEPSPTTASRGASDVISTGTPDDSREEIASCTDGNTGAQLTFDEAYAIAQTSPCIEEGALKETNVCNENTGTWWLDLESDRPECNPACVVDLNKRTAEINWRCTGALPLVETEIPVPEPLVSPTDEIPQEVIFQDITYQGVYFSYPEHFAADVSALEVPAEPFLMLEGNIIPQHLEFVFNGYLLPNAFHRAGIYVYPVQEFIEDNEVAAREIPRLQQLLVEKPAEPEGSIPFLPIMNAGEMMRTQLSYLDFQNGQGLRYLTQFGQSYLPINNRNMFYSFQGITGDGRYYVSLVLPVSHPDLPADETEIPGGDGEAFANNYETYAQEVEQQLDGQTTGSFLPDLAMIDALVSSIEITGDIYQQTIYDYTGWQTYSNEEFGYSVKVPAEVSILEAPDGSSVSFNGPLAENERWPMLSISHYASDFYRPGKAVEVRDWILDSEITYDEIGLEAELAGVPAIHLSVKATPQSYGFDHYFLIKDHQLFRIELLHTRGEEDWDLYNQFLDSFTFSE